MYILKSSLWLKCESRLKRGKKGFKEVIQTLTTFQVRDNVSPDKRGGFENARRDLRELEDEMHGTQRVGNSEEEDALKDEPQALGLQDLRLTRRIVVSGPIHQVWE